jgi:hypothetical protein
VTTVEIVRQEWAEGNRRVEAERELPARYRLLHLQVDVVTEQLRRRLGSVFTLEELAEEYRRAEPWVRDAMAELPPELRWPPGETTAADAAFHLYARGARDYKP